MSKRRPKAAMEVANTIARKAAEAVGSKNKKRQRSDSEQDELQLSKRNGEKRDDGEEG
jgi:hypothetical protein